MRFMRCNQYNIHAPRPAAFRILHPEIDVRIAANDALLQLDRDQIDLAVRFCEPGSAPP